VVKGKARITVKILKWLDFVEVQNPQSVVERFIKNAPENVPLSYDGFVSEVTKHHYGSK
jgi:hypothetical protein